MTALDRFKRRLAQRWLRDAMTADLSDNCTQSGSFGYVPGRGFDSEHPAWFDFSVHACPHGHRHQRPW